MLDDYRVNVTPDVGFIHIPDFLPFELQSPQGQDFIKTDVYSKVDIITVQPFHLLFNIKPEAIQYIDLFEEIKFSDEDMRRLEKPNGFLFYNLSMESVGYTFSNYFKMLTDSALKHNIPTEKIFYLSGNILDEQCYEVWQREYSPNHRINVFSTTYEKFPDRDKIIPITIDETVEQIRNLSNRDFRNFLSFNRVKRPLRVSLVYQILKSSIRKDTHLSYAGITAKEMLGLFKDLVGERDLKLDYNVVKYYQDSSPCVLDYSDFENNFAAYDYPYELYKKSLISIVSETLHDNHNDTNLFYSEKTFKPMLANHPIILVGQEKMNKRLKDIGYKTYENYFNLDFDNVEDYWTRIEKQIEYLEGLNERLNAMDTQQKINWLLQDVETLHYNKQAIYDQKYTNNFIQKLANRLSELIS